MSERLTTSERPLPRPDADLGYLFRLAHQRFRALLDSELEDLGLSAQEYGILSVFETRPELHEVRMLRKRRFCLSVFGKARQHKLGGMAFEVTCRRRLRTGWKPVVPIGRMSMGTTTPRCH